MQSVVCLDGTCMGDGVADGGGDRRDTQLELTKMVLRVRSKARSRGKVMQIGYMTMQQSGRSSTAKSHIDVAHVLIATRPRTNLIVSIS